MKQWFKIAVMQEGIREGVELIKAESAEEAKKVLDARSVTVDEVEYFLLYVL